jgi:exodeoxyribonuclease V alpha subunit
VTLAPTGPRGWSTVRADVVLRDFVDAGLVGHFERQLVTAALRSLGASADTATDDVLVALALVARATRLGHVCLELDEVGRQLAASREAASADTAVVVPETASWRSALSGSPLVAPEEEADRDPLRPMVLAGNRLYLQRYWAFEVAVAGQLRTRRQVHAHAPATTDEALVHRAVDDVFGPDADGGDGDGPIDEQRVAAVRALCHPVSVIAGGPGTGKTHTVARILVAAHRVAGMRGTRLRAALAAPTGKAANRMREAIVERVADMRADGRIDDATADELTGTVPTTIHRLLGSRGRDGFRHGHDDPVPFDLVIIDETSMVSLPMVARLLDAVRPDAHLVLVGDPFQLTSIEAGTVMGDMVQPDDVTATEATDRQPLAGRATELVRGHRFRAGSSMAELAQAIRHGDDDQVLRLLDRGDAEVHWVRPDEPSALASLRDRVAGGAREIVECALDGRGREALDAAQRIKVLAAVRHGPNGLFAWSDFIADRVRAAVPAARGGGWPRVGTPVMVTGNDPVNGLANGDVGVVVNDGSRPWVVMGAAEQLRMLAPARLGDWEPWWAMTIHKSQGSEFPHAVVALPTVDSPILTRELLYTAVTRGKPEVTVVGSEEIIRTAVRRPVARASGLRDRLWQGA